MLRRARIRPYMPVARVTLLTHPHGLADEHLGHRVLAAFEVDDRHTLAHLARDAKRRRVRFGRQRMQTLAFLRQPFDRRALRDAVRASIHPLTESIAITSERDEARVVGQSWPQSARSADAMRRLPPSRPSTEDQPAYNWPTSGQ